MDNTAPTEASHVIESGSALNGIKLTAMMSWMTSSCSARIGPLLNTADTDGTSARCSSQFGFPCRPHLDGVDEVQQDLALVVALHELHVLHDQVGGRPHAPDRQEDVVVQEVAGQALDLLRWASTTCESWSP